MALSQSELSCQFQWMGFVERCVKGCVKEDDSPVCVMLRSSLGSRTHTHTKKVGMKVNLNQTSNYVIFLKPSFSKDVGEEVCLSIFQINVVLYSVLFDKQKRM